MVRNAKGGDMQEDNANVKNEGVKEDAGFDADGTKDRTERKINYREEEVPDCGCIYG